MLSLFDNELKDYKLDARDMANILRVLQNPTSRSETEKRLRQFLIKKINVVSLNGISNINSIKKIINEPWIHKKNYVSLHFSDTIFDPMNPCLYKWYYSEAVKQSRSTVRTTYPLENIIAIRMSPLNVPLLSDVDLFTKICNISIQEFEAQSFSLPGRKYHFVTNVTNSFSDGYITQTAAGTVFDTTYANKGYYWFHKPYKTIPSFTVSFADPINLFQVIKPTVNVYIIPGPTTYFYIDKASELELDQKTNLNFKQFTTLNPVDDAAIISAINSDNGVNLSILNWSLNDTRVRGGYSLWESNVDSSGIKDMYRYLFYTIQCFDITTGIGYATVSNGGAPVPVKVMYTNPMRIAIYPPMGNHGFTTGDNITFSNFGCSNSYGTFADAAFITNISTGTFQITVIDDQTFTIPVDAWTPIDYEMLIRGEIDIRASNAFMYKTVAVIKNPCRVESALPRTLDVYFTPGPTTYLNISNTGILQTMGLGNKVYLKNFTTLDPLNPADLTVINTINNVNGVTLSSGAVSLDSSGINYIDDYLYYTSQICDTYILNSYAYGSAFVADNTGIFWIPFVAAKYSNPMQIKTFTPHGFINGTVVKFTGFNCHTYVYPMFASQAFVDSINNNTYVATVIDDHTFSIPVDALAQVNYSRLTSGESTYRPVESFLYKSTAQLSTLDILPVIQLEVIQLDK